MNLYLTADSIGEESGGGKVTLNESKALEELGPCKVWGRRELSQKFGLNVEPWCWDGNAFYACRKYGVDYQLVHVYSGTFSRTVAYLKEKGSKVCYTVAAHDREISRREHEKLGLGFPYPHLTNDDLWQKYVEGYRLADVIVCPGKRPAEIVRAYGKDFENKRIEIIPHGCDLPDEATIKPLPERFAVGYMGSCSGADKGVRYLLEAWKKLNYLDATLLLAGRDSASDWVRQMVGKYGGGSISLLGWVKDPADFYNQISLLVQPSATEGFGLEVLEALSHSRPVICSDQAGAVDCIQHGCGFSFHVGQSDVLAECIDQYKRNPAMAEGDGPKGREVSAGFTWDKIRARYADLWKSLLK